jgi:secondary thiamine-phosphate synthase enzyme
MNTNWFKETIEITTHGKGLYVFTPAVSACLRRWGVREGMCYLYCQHTSASLVIGENYDPSAAADMQTFMERLAPEGQDWYEHTLEGDDDSPAHLRAMLTPTSQTIPVDDGQLSLGTWQGLYLFEHRAGPHRRRVLVRALSIE